MDMISNFAANYPKSGIRTIFDLLPQYPNAINLCNGEPSFDTPKHIKDAAMAAISEGFTKYSQTTGIDELRKAIAFKCTKQFGNTISPGQVMVACGGTEAIAVALLGAVNPGDEVIVNDPCYPNYISQIKLIGATAVRVPLLEKNQFKMDLDDLRNAITPKTKAIILNYPNNPLGVTLDEEYAKELASVLAKHDITILSDEVYEALTFDNIKHFSLFEIPEINDRVIIINSFSKTYAMTGWRIGYIVAPKDFVSKVNKLQESLVSCLPVFIQKAATVALESSQDCVAEMVSIYEDRRNIIFEGINSIPGFSCIKAQGGFCLMANIKSFNKSSKDFATELLEKAEVATVPGSAFGDTGEGYIRFCFANSTENIIEAIRRIREYIIKTYN